MWPTVSCSCNKWDCAFINLTHPSLLQPGTQIWLFSWSLSYEIWLLPLPKTETQLSQECQLRKHLFFDFPLPLLFQDSIHVATGRNSFIWISTQGIASPLQLTTDWSLHHLQKYLGSGPQKTVRQPTIDFFSSADQRMREPHSTVHYKCSYTLQWSGKSFNFPGTFL